MQLSKSIFKTSHIYYSARLTNFYSLVQKRVNHKKVYIFNIIIMPAELFHIPEKEFTT